MQGATISVGFSTLLMAVAMLAHAGGVHAAPADVEAALPRTVVHNPRLTQLSQDLGALLQSAALRHAKVGLHVIDVEDGTELFAHAIDQTFIPASNVKLVTTAAALTYLGPDFQFSTDVYGRLGARGRIDGDLMLHGEGDPYLTPERVWYLATRLVFLGVYEVLGDIVVDDGYFAGNLMAKGAEQDLSSAAYMAPAGAMSVGFNAVMVHVLPGTEAGMPASVFVDPHSDYASLLGQVRTVAQGPSRMAVSIQPGPGGMDLVHVDGHIRAGDVGRSFWRRIHNPPLFAGHIVREALHQVGIAVRGKVRHGSIDAGVPRLLQISSPRLAELLVPLNKYSSNFMAMQVALALGAKRYGAPGTWPKAQQALRDFLADEVGIAEGTYSINNASGLHDVNLLSPSQITTLLRHMAKTPEVSFEFVTSLAVGAGSGTLQDRMLASPAAHVVRAKTGTLTTASALSGYATTRDHRTLAFSFLVNHYRHIHEVWDIQDKFAARLADLDLSGTASMPN